MLFSHFIPKAWSVLLESLVLNGGPMDIWHAWPSGQSLNSTADTAYWTSLLPALVSAVVSRDSAVWPVHPAKRSAGQTTYERLSSSLIAASAEGPVLDALAAAGLKIVQLPSYIHDILTSSHSRSCTTLSPATVYERLKVRCVHCRDWLDLIHVSRRSIPTSRA